MIIHRHWIILVFKSLYFLGLIITTLLAFTFKDEIIDVGDAIFWTGEAVFWWGMCIFWIMYLTFIYLNWLNDELDLFVITNIRIIGVDQESSLTRTISECSLDRVQEVNAQISGVFQTIFSYGKMHIHTASEHSDMTVTFAPDPVENARKINNIIQEYRSSHGDTIKKEVMKSWI
jgi:Bacterial PH domain